MSGRGPGKASPQGWLNSFLYPLFFGPPTLDGPRYKLETRRKNPGSLGDQIVPREQRDMFFVSSSPFLQGIHPLKHNAV